MTKNYGLLCCWFWISLAQAFYEPQLSVHYKHGRYREVGRVQILYPLAQNSRQLFYTTVMGLLDSQYAREGNVGLGYRLLRDRAILGGYGFYDLRKTFYQNRMQQMTLGVEYLTLHDELRTNLYLPFSAAKSISGQSILNTYSLQNTIVNQKEKPLSGFDVEWIHYLSFMPSVQWAAGYYYFAASHVKCIQGPRMRLDYPITPWLSIEGEGSYDKIRNLNYFIGVRLALTLDLKQTLASPLMHKMTKMPIRDIDVIVQAYSWDGMHTEPAFVIATPAELQSMGSGIDGMTLDANYVLDSDIDLRDFKTTVHSDGTKGFKPIGTKVQPFTGRFFGKDHVIKGLFVEDKQEEQSLGLFSATRGILGKPVLIEGIHLEEVTMLGGNHAHIGGLIGTMEHTTICHVSMEGCLEGGDGKVRLGGLVGWAFGQSSLCDVRSISQARVGNCIGTLFSNDNLFAPEIGGLIGGMQETRLQKAYSTSTIWGGRWVSAGGVVGSARDSYLYKVQGKAQIVQIGKDFADVGGLVGRMYSTQVYQAYSHSTLEADWQTTVGGLIGTVRDQSHLWNVYSISHIKGKGVRNVGGLIGHMLRARLECAYSQSHIHVEKGPSGSCVGGLVGRCKQNQIFEVGSSHHLEVSGHRDQVGGLMGQMEQDCLERAYSLGSIQVKNRACAGGLVGQLGGLSTGPDCPGDIYLGESYLGDAYSASQIEGEAGSKVGGLVGEIQLAQLERAYFSGTLKGPHNATMGAIWAEKHIKARLTSVYWNEDRLRDFRKIQPKLEEQLGHYEAKNTAQMINANTFAGWFDKGVWLMGPEGPELIWPKRRDALVLLYYINSLGRFKRAFTYLPLELKLLIFFYVQWYHALNATQIARLLHYAFTAMESEVEGKARKLWRKEEFLAYVLKEAKPLIPDPSISLKRQKPSWMN